MKSGMTGFIRVTGLTVLALLLASTAWAEVVRIEVDSRVELADGAAGLSNSAHSYLTVSVG